MKIQSLYKGKGKIRFEDLYKVNQKIYFREHKFHEQRGVAIPDGERVVMTLWAEQNGLRMGKNGEQEYIKTGTCRDGWRIKVKKLGNKQSNIYWAGFWKEF